MDKHVDTIDTGRGAVLGALVGDAAGSTLEFLHAPPTRDEVDRAMNMVGGGVWNNAPGQITDDGEMMLCLMHALAGTSSFSIEGVARQYLRWYESKPFDMGNTTRNGLSGGRGQPPGGIHEGMWTAADQSNRESKANGALMRIAPLGVWGSRLTEEELVYAARQDAGLTHPNRTCQDTSAVYCIAIRFLLHHPGDSEGAFHRAVAWADTFGNREIRGWLDDAESGIDIGYTPNIGFVRYGFTHAFRHLRQRTPYIDAIRETLSGGGDTDTNACIVGGLTGALQGEDGIPAQMKEAIFNCDTDKGNPRPEFLRTRSQLPGLLDGVLL